MKALPFDQSMIDDAREWSSSLGSIKNSITKGKGNVAGRIGELAVSRFIGAEITDSRNFDLDWKGEHIEVKTKRRVVKPKPDYEVSVAMTSTHQKPDRYVFVSLEFASREPSEHTDNYFDLQKVWLCGDKKTEDYFSEGRLMKKGRKDKSNGFVVRTDMVNLRMDELDQSF